jgi:hypothetical protein
MRATTTRNSIALDGGKEEKSGMLRKYIKCLNTNIRAVWK